MLVIAFHCKAGTRLLDIARKKLFVCAVAVLRAMHNVLDPVSALEKFYRLQDAMLRYDPLHRISARQTLLHESPAQTTVSPPNRDKTLAKLTPQSHHPISDFRWF